MSTNCFQCGGNGIGFRLLVSFNFENVFLQPIFHRFMDAVFHNLTFYHLAIASSCRATVPCSGTFLRMREIAFHNGTAFFAEQDSGKGIFQFSLGVNGGVFIFCLDCSYSFPLFFRNDRLMESIVELVVIVQNAGLCKEAILDHFLHRFSAPADLSQVHFVGQNVHDGGLAPLALSGRDVHIIQGIGYRVVAHALYITNVSKEKPDALTQLNYQFLATVSIQPDEFRPADLPGGWDHSPAEDERNWLTKATEQLYYDLRVDEHSRREFFLESLSKQGISKHSKEYIMASVLRKNPLFLNDPVYTKQLDARAEQILKDYAVGRLMVAGDIRYLSGDLLALLFHIGNKNEAASLMDIPFRIQVLTDQFAKNSFYAPGAAYEKGGICTLLRNPHIARNEEIQLSVYPEDEIRDHFFGHLTDVVMVDAKMLAAERLGGADYDGDLVRTISDPVLNACVRRNYTFNHYAEEMNLTNSANLPFLMIPSMASPKQSPKDWYARFVTVKNTFSARIGQICNAALDRSVIAYNEKTDPKQRKKFQEETEVLAILSGLEIDAAKTGIRPDLSDYLGKKIPRTPFLKYKTMVEDAEERREWYEDTHQQKLDKFFADTDWEQMDSPMERLPLLARKLKKGTKKAKTKKATDAQLFVFAQEKDWQSNLNSRTLARVEALLTDYEACLKRIRSCRSPSKENKRKADIERILYRRGQEDIFDTDELYALFQTVDPEHLSKLRSAIREENWHLMNEAQRENFLVCWLPGPDFGEWYDLLTDFWHYGFRVLGDVVGDIDDANNGADCKQLHRVGDSEAFASMMQAYIDHPRAKYYRDAVARECRDLLRDIVNLNQAVQYIVALGKRNLLWDLVPDLIEKNVIAVEVDGNAE